MPLPPNFLDELRARTPIATVVARRVRLARSGRHWKGNCPFHNEKSPSFYVYEDGYHCFGCGAHGDAIAFVMQSQGAGFMEAVEQLAAEAGMQVPKPTPAAAEAERRRLDLHGVLDAAASAYQRRLHLPEGRAGLDYLRARGLTDDTIARFGLGWSGDGRGGLQAELARQDISPERLLEAGLLREAEDGRAPRELFYNRVMFPIRDRRGRAISFGGRMLGDGQPKYVNGPETSLFSKRRTLYALDLAREAARAGETVLAVEGYMDVIALHQAGFTAAVAPLGTALAEEQLEELWRLSPMPTLCFDGDAAGARAALRALTIAVPLTTPARSLACVYLGRGRDPADIAVGPGGREEFNALLGQKQPFEKALFVLLSGQYDLKAPAGRARFMTRLEELASTIPDRSWGWEVRQEWRAAFKQLTWTPRPTKGGKPYSRPPLILRTPPSAAAAHDEKARTIVAILLRHPALVHDVGDAFVTLDLPTPFARLRDAILEWADGTETLDSDALMSHLQHFGLAAESARALSAAPMPLPACASPEAMPAEAEAGWWHFFGLMNPGRLDADVAAAAVELNQRGDAVTERRLRELSIHRERLRRGEHDAPDPAGPEDAANT